MLSSGLPNHFQKALIWSYDIIWVLVTHLIFNTQGIFLHAMKIQQQILNHKTFIDFKIVATPSYMCSRWTLICKECCFIWSNKYHSDSITVKKPPTAIMYCQLF